ncbi:carbohydrate kinase family protein [Nocardia sp. NPDC052566]|uniref:carbohydrate kinase family protein n=1 Tax=Nocardia sp. NPDC052566 TaxID=3364330 RepID=UPI0037C94A19
MILVTGSVATDHLMKFPGRFADQLLPDHLDHVSLSFLVDDLVVQRGGVAGNICYGLGVLGQRPVLAAAVGTDFREYEVWLSGHGVETGGAWVSYQAHTARFTCTTDDDLAQLASFYPGAMSEASRISLAELVERFGRPELVVVGANDPAAMIKHTNEARALGIPFAADPSQQLARLDAAQIRDLLDGASYLLTNEYEWGLLQSKAGVTAEQVIENSTIRVTTLGAQGVEITDRQGAVLHVPAVAANATVDPTGVGDGFRAGFLHAQANGASLARSAQLGSAVAVLVLEASGPQGWRWDREAAVKRIADAYGRTAADEIEALWADGR